MDTLFVALRVLLSLGAVLALLWFLQRRFARGGLGVQSAKKDRSAHTLSVVQRQGVGGKSSVVVVEYGEKYFLLGVSESNVTLLHSADLVSSAAENDEAREAPVAPVRALTAVNMQESTPASASTSTSASTSDDFAAVMAQAGLENLRTENSEPVYTSRAAAKMAKSQGRLAGSILAPDTWKQAAAFVRNSR